MMAAALSDSAGMVRLLMESGAVVDGFYNFDAAPPLHVACAMGHSEAVIAMIETG